MPKTLTVFSPVDGAIVPLEQVPDPVFSEHMLGDGIAVDPANDVVFAPFDGKIINFNKASHALVLGRDGVEVLIHVGLETVSLKGEGFEPLAKSGDNITKGQPLLKFSQEVLAKKASSPFVMIVVTSPADVPATNKKDGLVKAGEALFEVATSAEGSSEEAGEAFTESAPIVVLNPNGLHARPAAVLSKIAAAHPFAVQLTKDGETADAKSIVGIMGLALNFNDKVTVRAAGPESEARAVIAKLEEGFKDSFGEKDAAPAESYDEAPVENGPSDFSKPAEISGLSACGGLSQGNAFLFVTEDLAFEENAADPKAEQALLDNTLRTIISETQAKINAEHNHAAQEILTAHLGILQDPLLAKTAQETIARGKTAAFGFNEAVRHSVDVLKKTNNRFLMERIADLKDLRRAVILRVSGAKQTAPVVPEKCILVAEELLPSEVSAFGGRVAGVILAQGSPTAHASIMLRNMGVPTLVRAGQRVLDIPANAFICLDADVAKAFVNPEGGQCKMFEERLQKNREEQAKERKEALNPSKTTDGKLILVEGNVSNEKEAAQAAENGADGLGLVRTEFLFHGRQQAPSLEEQRAAYQAVLTAAAGRGVVTFRTLDAGGDKPLPFVDIPAEENPIVGIRGVRAFARNEAFFRTQIRAMLSVKPADKARIMLPMITFTDEVDTFKKIIAEEKAALGVTAQVPVGIMVEVPSAALTSEQFAARADFFSVGTNDLTQYTLAIDRGHKDLSAQSDHLHPAVLKLIELTCEGAKKHNKPVAVCGAMAGDLTAIPFLIGLGVTELAVGAGAVAQVKALVRRLDAKKCEQAAKQAVQMASAKEVRALAKQEFGV